MMRPICFLAACEPALAARSSAFAVRSVVRFTARSLGTEEMIERMLLTQKQHECANQRKHAYADSEAVRLDQHVVVDQNDAERGWLA